MYSTPLMAERKVLPAQQFQSQREIGQVASSMTGRSGERRGAGRPPKYKTEEERIAARKEQYTSYNHSEKGQRRSLSVYHSDKGQKRYLKSQSIKREMRLQNDLLPSTSPQSESI